MSCFSDLSYEKWFSVNWWSSRNIRAGILVFPWKRALATRWNSKQYGLDLKPYRLAAFLVQNGYIWFGILWDFSGFISIEIDKLAVT